MATRRWWSDSWNRRLWIHNKREWWSCPPMQYESAYRSQGNFTFFLFLFLILLYYLLTTSPTFAQINKHVIFPKRHSCLLQVCVAIRVFVAPTFKLLAQSKPLSVTNHRLELEVYYEQELQADYFTWRVSLSRPSNWYQFSLSIMSICFIRFWVSVIVKISIICALTYSWLQVIMRKKTGLNSDFAARMLVGSWSHVMTM